MKARVALRQKGWFIEANWIFQITTEVFLKAGAMRSYTFGKGE